jgi:hypothetical protein
LLYKYKRENAQAAILSGRSNRRSRRAEKIKGRIVDKQQTNQSNAGTIFWAGCPKLKTAHQN